MATANAGDAEAKCRNPECLIGVLTWKEIRSHIKKSRICQVFYSADEFEPPVSTHCIINFVSNIRFLSKPVFHKQIKKIKFVHSFYILPKNRLAPQLIRLLKHSWQQTFFDRLKK